MYSGTVKCTPVLWVLRVQCPTLKLMCYLQSLDESPTFLSHHRPARLNCLGLTDFISEISCMSSSLHTFCTLLYPLCLPLFYVDFPFRFYLTLSHFASLSLLCHCTSVSLFLLNLSLCSPPPPCPTTSPSTGHSSHRSCIPSGLTQKRL